MAARDFDFVNAAGRHLSGALETGAVQPRAYAIFAHCFTCNKNSLAATRLSRALADRGVGVLRFDFTGLGKSEGEFGRGLSSDVQDIVCAATAMADRGMAPQLLIGHSFGGAAVLAAAGALEGIRAVAVIGAPFAADHVLAHLGTALENAAEGRVSVAIAGREFCLGTDFVEDIRSHNQQERIATLGRALLVMHSPIDEIVSIDNAASIFLAARHPKSFVSLDNADHLLLRKADADYAADVVAAWAGRYLHLASEETPPVQGVRVEETRAGKFQVRVLTPSTTFIVDEPASVGGLDSGPTPYDLLSAGLGACTAMTCRLYADQKGWPLDGVVVEVGHMGKTATAPDLFVRKIGLQGELDEDQSARLIEIAERCPVHRTLAHGSTIETRHLADGLADEGAPDDPQSHARLVQEACADASNVEV